MRAKPRRGDVGCWDGVLALVTLLTVGGCGDSPSEPALSIDDIVGTYELTQLTFDPQGVLPETDILAALGTTPQLIVTSSRAAQILYEDPFTSLFTTIGATVRTTSEGLRIDFNNGSGYGGLLLSRRMAFQFTAATGSLSFDGDAPDGVSRQRLIQLVPGWSGEQLLNPVPGQLRVTFQKS